MAEWVSLSVLELPTGVQPPLGLHRRWPDGPGLPSAHRPHAHADGSPDGEDDSRLSSPATLSSPTRKNADVGSHGRATCVRSDDLEAALWPADAEDLHQRRTCPSHRGDRAQHTGLGPSIARRVSPPAERSE